jgi:RNA polymerase sigma-70 factor, ECF subfamily
MNVLPRVSGFCLSGDNQMDDTALISSARMGDLEAFNCLVLNYQDLIYRQAYHLLGDQEGAEDAVQEAFLSAYRHLRVFRDGNFKCWLLRIVTNTCYDELRRRKRRRTIALEPVDSHDDAIESTLWLEDPQEPPETRAERSDLRRQLQGGLESLPPDFREVVVLVDIQGLDYQEAARAAGIPVGTLKSRLARARMKLRQRLETLRTRHEDTQAMRLAPPKSGMDSFFDLPRPFPREYPC